LTHSLSVRAVPAAPLPGCEQRVTLRDHIVVIRRLA
jgi:hypothetical protein